MGQIHPKQPDEGELRSREIDKTLKEDYRKSSQKISVLLLGTEDSDKTLIFHQLELLNDGTFNGEDLKDQKALIYKQIIKDIKALLINIEKLVPSVTYNQNIAQMILDIQEKPNSVDFEKQFPTSIWTDIGKLWQDSSFQLAYNHKDQFYVDDTLKYYIDAFDRISKANYVPTAQDVLRCRLKKSPIVEETFRYNHAIFKFIDVELKNDLRKLIHCFQDVFAIIFCINLLDYRKTQEDKSNKMKETIKQISEMANSKWLEKKPTVFIYTRAKEFKLKLQETNLRVCFSDYTGGNNFDAAIEFIKAQFATLPQIEGGGNRDVFSQTVDVLDATAVTKVFNNISDHFVHHIHKYNA